MTEVTDHPAYLATAAMMPMLRLQGLTLAAMRERKVINSREARALVQEAADHIEKLRVDESTKDLLRQLYAQLKDEM